MHDFFARARSLWGGLLRRPTLGSDMYEEFRLHIELRTEDLIRSGLSPTEAARRARLEFGSTERYKEEGRESRGLKCIDELLGDVKYAARSLRKAPGFTLVAVVTLGLGVGATSALFSVIYGVLMRPLPYPQPEQIVRIHTLLRGEEQSNRDVSPPNFVSVAEESRSFKAMSAVISGDLTLSGAGEARTVESARVSASFFEVMGVRPVLGRPFLPGENERGNERVVVLGDGLWQRVFGGDARMVGRTISLDGAPHMIVGVMPPGFSFPADAELWVPLAYGSRYSATTADGRYRNTWLPVFGRLHPGVGLEQGLEELRSLGRRLEAAFPETNAEASFGATPLHEEMVGQVKMPLLLLFGAVVVVLLVACANVLGLQMARAATREGEMGVRAALGAGRGRLIRQLLTESWCSGCSAEHRGWQWRSGRPELL
jgi:putative ABC transport system permease protein